MTPPLLVGSAWWINSPLGPKRLMRLTNMYFVQFLETQFIKLSKKFMEIPTIWKSKPSETKFEAILSAITVLTQMSTRKMSFYSFC